MRATPLPLATAVLTAALLAGCAPRPQADTSLPPLPADTPWPALLPTDSMNTADPDAIAALEDEAAALEARAAALRARAAAMTTN